MPSVSLIVEHLDSLLDPAAFDDFGPNGLQVPGATRRKPSPRRSPPTQLFTRGAKRAPTSCSPTTGSSGRPAAPASTRRQAPPQAPASTHDIALAAYHLPLDAHPELGNNALLAAALGARAAGPVRRARRATIGVVARCPDAGIAPDELVARVRAR